MRNLLFLAAAVASISLAGAKPAPLPAPTPPPAAPVVESAITIDDIIATAAHQAEIAKDIGKRADTIDAANKDLNGHLTEANAIVNKTLDRADTLQKRIDEQGEQLRLVTADRDSQKTGRLKAEADLSHVLGKYHWLKILGASLFAGLIFLLIWKWSPPVTGPWQIAIYIGPPVIAWVAFFALF